MTRTIAQYTGPMAEQTCTVSPGPRAGTVIDEHGQIITVPAGWVLLPPGDAALTGRVKRAGPSWTVQERRGRKLFSRGVWAPESTVTSIRATLAVERAAPAYARKLESGRSRRAAAQAQYEEDFAAAVFQFLSFAPAHTELANRLAKAIADHAVPVGSGTVARTQRIPIEKRAEAAAIAWLRHATTGYDNMDIPRIQGMRREVRRLLAERSRCLLGRYRRGDTIPEGTCLLWRGLHTRQPNLNTPEARP